MCIRKAKKEDVSRIAEILVYNYRTSYFPIFNDEKYSFGKIQVLAVIKEYEKAEMLEKVYVYDDDGIIKGFIQISLNEAEKLYVDTFFHSVGIGRKLLEFAVKEKNVEFLWVLEKNLRAIKFYEKMGFEFSDERLMCEGTDEYMLKMTLKSLRGLK